MFWRRKRIQPDGPVFQVQSYAAQLGIERRRDPRILCPDQNLSSLPSVFFGARSLRVHDISAGGLCLLDREGYLGPDAGQELELRLIWPGCERVVRCRIVSRVDVRRHIQFLDLDGDRLEALKSAIVPGTLGQLMKPVLAGVDSQVKVQAKQIWSSTKGDSLTFFETDPLTVELGLGGRTFRMDKGGWPKEPSGAPANPADIESMLVWLTNFPRPSAAVHALAGRLKTLCTEGRP